MVISPFPSIGWAVFHAQHVFISSEVLQYLDRDDALPNRDKGGYYVQQGVFQNPSAG
jgi:hypothetical protein